MHKKYIIIILAVVCLAYGNSLLNGFVGDDEIVLVNNRFYDSWSNFPKLFSKEYNTNSDNNSIFIGVSQNANSGSVAYRPVLSTAFFIDRSLWGLHPFGYHLTNFLLHAFNAILIYLLIFSVLKNQNVAMLSSLLFAVHPINAEAVCNIGFRADLLAVFFVLLSFLYFAKLEYPGIKPRKAFVLSLVFYFLSLFTKESAIVLPFIFIAYDFYFRRETNPEFLQTLAKRYTAFILVTLFYLYVYFFQFPNTALDNAVSGAGPNWASIAKIFLILGQYVVDFLAPAGVHVIPPQYSPVIDSTGLIKAIWSLTIFILFIVFIFKAKKIQYPSAFFLFWFLVSLLPVANIIPNPNPLAYRYLYLPSIGFLTVMALGLEYMDAKLKSENSKIQIAGTMVKLGLVVLLAVLTIPLTLTWRNEYTLASMIIEYYPKNPGGYLFRGTVYFKYGLLEKAKEDLQKSLELGMFDPRGLEMLSVCLPDEPQKAKQLLERSIKFFPNFALSYTALGRLLLFEGDHEKALPYFQKSIQLTPTYTGFGYLIQVYLMKGDKAQAQGILKEAKEKISAPIELKSLNSFFLYDEKPDKKFPVDIGV